MSSPDETASADSHEFTPAGEPPVMPPASAEMPRVRRKPKSGAMHWRDDDGDQRADSVFVDPDGDGPLPAEEKPIALIPWQDGAELEVALLGVREKPRPPLPDPPSIGQVIQSIEDQANARVRAATDALREANSRASRWLKWLWGSISFSGIAYLFMALYYFNGAFGGGAVYVESHSERFLRDAINKPGSWIDGILPEEQAEAVEAVKADRREREGD